MSRYCDRRQRIHGLFRHPVRGSIHLSRGDSLYAEPYQDTRRLNKTGYSPFFSPVVKMRERDSGNELSSVLLGAFLTYSFRKYSQRRVA